MTTTTVSVRMLAVSTPNEVRHTSKIGYLVKKVCSTAKTRISEVGSLFARAASYPFKKAPIQPANVSKEPLSSMSINLFNDLEIAPDGRSVLQNPDAAKSNPPKFDWNTNKAYNVFSRVVEMYVPIPKNGQIDPSKIEVINKNGSTCFISQI
jgi:hypothetical protein